MTSMDRRKQLGQYFTPLTVIDFALDVLAYLDADAESGRRLIIDPACGDAGFLRRAVDRGLVTPGNAFGTDSDADLRSEWDEQGLAGAGMPLQIADGLLAEAIDGHVIEPEGFDWVIGNPPYAGVGLKSADTDALARIADRFELPAARHRKLIAAPEDCRRLPIEVLFVERFLQLCRPGGLIAIVLPMGLFANARWRFVREWLLPQVTLHLIAQLPRGAFRAGGITAHTCLAIAGKQPAPPGHQVCMAQVDHIGAGDQRNELGDLLGLWKSGASVVGEDTPWRL